MVLMKKYVDRVDGPARGRGRSKRTWMEVKKIDLKKCNISNNVAQDRSKWRNNTHVADPNIFGTRL